MTEPSIPPRRSSRWLGRSVLLLALCAAVVLVLALMVSGLHVTSPVQVSIDGHEVFSAFDLVTMPPAHKVVMAGVILISLLAALVILPIALLMAVFAIVLMALVLVGLPLVAIVLVLSLLMSPLILIGWLLWRALAS